MPESIEEMKIRMEESRLERLSRKAYPECNLKCAGCYLASPNPDYQINGAVTCEKRFYAESGKMENPSFGHKQIRGA
ncbi:hypothetical protein JXB27_01835 [Candidatus Woesearchaeota archaeon]|nr:hypothetical protein [Candidatus Woesearchaeota archaeon]